MKLRTSSLKLMILRCPTCLNNCMGIYRVYRLKAKNLWNDLWIKVARCLRLAVSSTHLFRLPHDGQPAVG